MGGIHDTRFTAPQLPPAAYVGDQTFHTQAYLRPSGLVLLGACVTADFLVRPAGHLLMIFGARDTGDKLNQAGLDLIDAAMQVPFL